MDGADALTVQWVGSIRLNVANLGRAVHFYRAGLGFTLEHAHARTAILSLGGEQLILVEAPSGAAPYPPQPAANDPWFQHFAVRVSDMDAAYQLLVEQKPIPISISGPQQLPPSSGSVIAYKFRDPDGHPLELSFKPGQASPAPSASPFEAIDHSAFAVTDLEESLAFWVGLLGFKETARVLNQGPTQWRLDGIEGALVDIVVLHACGGGPHVELLHYRHPVSSRSARRFGPEDIPATRVQLRATSEVISSTALALWEVRSETAEGRLILVDPDNHLVEMLKGAVAVHD